MSKKYEEKTTELVLKVLEELNLGIELFDVEYVKEAGTNYLRVFIDKPEGVTIDDCVALTEPMNELLDSHPFIDEAYIFEVSSPGLDRPLKKDKDFDRNIGKKIEIKSFAPINGEKEFEGILVSYNENEINVNIDGNEVGFERKKLALIRQAIDF